MAFKMKGFPMIGTKTHAKSNHKEADDPYVGERRMIGGQDMVYLKGDAYGDGTWVISGDATKDAEIKAAKARIKANKEAGVYEPGYDGSVEPEYEK